MSKDVCHNCHGTDCWDDESCTAARLAYVESALRALAKLLAEDRSDTISLWWVEEKIGDILDPPRIVGPVDQDCGAGAEKSVAPEGT